ncbi:hypothetical protein BRD05_04445 [Halobacteriales archaeon QS_9_70_65]|nr:MAG: hypothetical protein BRD05_04445 [Halobacteriales archaeon QS_9_70_65]
MATGFAEFDALANQVADAEPLAAIGDRRLGFFVADGVADDAAVGPEDYTFDAVLERRLRLGFRRVGGPAAKGNPVSRRANR